MVFSLILIETNIFIHSIFIGLVEIYLNYGYLIFKKAFRDTLLTSQEQNMCSASQSLFFTKEWESIG